MRLDRIRDVLVTIENRIDVNTIKARGVHLWPILRLCIRQQLAIDDVQQQESVNNKLTFPKKVIGLSLRFASKIKRCVEYYLKAISHRSDSEIMFFTRPVYLQALESNLLFDRIVDPLITVLKDKEIISKYCLGIGSKPNNLYFDVSYISPNELHFPNVTYEVSMDDFNQIAEIAGLDAKSLFLAFKSSCTEYFRWYKFGKKLFSRARSLNHIYVTSWYFPDMMGLIAAAKELGVETTDLQHGQQGKYQIMYSSWSKIPPEGYSLIPDKFWCWGQQSVNHIMNLNNNTKAHQAFVGGYPWIDFYKKNLQASDMPVDSNCTDNNTEVLFTLQPPSVEHQVLIPDFILDFLDVETYKSVSFNFRCHPNFKDCQKYVEARLKNISDDRYRITSSESILCNDFLTATHHITAFSSCCYEAEVFGIPTLLFGAYALENYKDEIKQGVFTWSNGSLESISNWLCSDIKSRPSSNYIITSMDLAKKCLQ